MTVDLYAYTSAYLCLSVIAKPGEENVQPVSGYTGHSVQIKVKYEDIDQKKQIYLCKNEDDGCKLKIRVNEKDQWVTDHKTSIYHNTTGKVVLVHMSGLSMKDSGKYFCAQNESFQNGLPVAVDKFKAIQLNVYPGINIITTVYYVKYSIPKTIGQYTLNVQ